MAELIWAMRGHVRSIGGDPDEAEQPQSMTKKRLLELLGDQRDFGS